MDNSQQSQQTSPIPPPSPESPRNLGWIKWVLIIVIIAILSSSGTYFVLNSQSQKQPPAQIIQTPLRTTPTTDPTANWKIYSNDTYSFSFRYPAEFDVLKNSADYIPPYNLENLVILIRKQGLELSKAQYKQAANFSISTSSNVSNCYMYRDNIITEKQTINGIDYYVTQSFGAGAGNAIGGKIYRVIKNNFCLEVQSSIVSSTGSGEELVDAMPQVKQDEQELQNALDKILSTFKFTE